MNWIYESIKLFFINIRAGFSFVRGLYWISYLKEPIITIFGGHHVGVEASYLENAHKVAYRCVEEGYSVLSGGGPGMMQAANCGAFEASLKFKDKPLRTFGIGVERVDADFINVCGEVLTMDSFYTRKWLLTRYSAAFIIFPGGIGTADELFEVLNSLKLKRIEPRPVILFGSEYWKPLVTWIENSGIQNGFIASHNRTLFHVTDDVQGVMNLLKESLSHKSF